MRIAVPTWTGRVSPVFDVAGRLLVIDVVGREAAFQEEYPLIGSDPVHALSELRVDVLLCGALSRDLEERLLASGVEVVAEVRGQVQDVVRAYLGGNLMQPRFSMPGCHSRRRHGRRAPAREEPASEAVLAAVTSAGST